MKTITHYDEPFLDVITTKVLECKEDKGEYLISLQESLFFVESGGQASDEGTIDGKVVKEVYIYDGTIYHVLDEPVSGEVVVKIDMKTRFDHMQAHSSQHLVGAICIYELHMPVLSNHYLKDGMADLDLDVDHITQEQLTYLENRVNELITEDVPFTISYVDEDQAKEYCEGDFEDYKDFDEFRVVTIEGIEHDLCGCVHVPSTRYLKAINIVSCTKVSHGTKIVIDAGDHLIKNAHKYYDALNEVSTDLGVPFEEIQDGIQHIRSEYHEANKKMEEYRTKYLDLLVENTLAKHTEDINLICVDDPSLSLEDMKYLLVNFSKHDNNVGVGLKEESGKLSLVISRSKNVNHVNCGNIFKEIRKQSKIRGGGSPFVAQGGGEVFENYKEVILNLVQKEMEEK